MMQVDPPAQVSAMNDLRFTLDGSEDLEKQLGQICHSIANSIRALIPGNQFEALLLGGGYGRGEGGVLETPAGDAPYNDLEFYLLLKGPPSLNERRYGRAIHELCEKLSGEIGIEVEIKILSAAKLEKAEVSMFYYDLVMGHRWLGGDQQLLNLFTHHRAAHRIPLAEAARLLMNRCSGLLYSAERLRRAPFTESDADFVGRNIAKAQLALGDVWLAANGQYHWSCRERHHRLEKICESQRPVWFDRLLAFHEIGRDFKLRPRRAAGDLNSLLVSHQEIKRLALEVWFWLESKRLNQTFDSVRAYSLDTGNKCPESQPWRNCLVNVKRFGASSLFDPLLPRYPRERLFNTLPLLLWQNSCEKDRFLLQFLQKTLRAQAATFSELVSAYELIWRAFN